MSEFKSTFMTLDLLHRAMTNHDMPLNAQGVNNVRIDLKTIVARLEAAEAELARRDAAVGEPVAYTDAEKQALIYWLRNEINLIESARDETPFGLDADGEMALKGICTALSALEAKPACYTGSGSLEAVKAGCEGYIWRDCENSHPIGLYTTPPAPSATITKNVIREVFMRNGFTIKDGQDDLKQYVYDAAYELIRLAAAPAPGES